VPSATRSFCIRLSGCLSETAETPFSPESSFDNCRKIGRLPTTLFLRAYCRAMLFNSSQNGNSLAKTALYLFKSYLLTFWLSIQKRNALLRMNCTVLIASSTA
jgi:hypothetical protein